MSGPASASFEAGYTDKRIKEHRRAEVLDHADGSVTEEKLKNNAVTDKKIGERTIGKPDGEGTTTGTLTSLLNTITAAMKTHVSNNKAALRGKADKKTAGGGFEGGEGASAESGGAVGAGAVTNNGFAGGENAKTAIVYESVDAFGGGVVTTIAQGIDAIQLGTGTNSNEKTLQIYDHQLLDAKGHIPVGRLQNAGGGFAAGEGATVDYNKRMIDAIQLGAGTNDTPKTLQVYDYQLLNASGKIPEDRLPKKKMAIIVGTSTEGHTLDMCDYLCSGSYDNIAIGNAITRARTTGVNKVFLLPGTYKLNSYLSFGSSCDMTLCGSGHATVLERNWSGTAQGVIECINLKNHIIIENLCIDGNRDIYNTGKSHGIHLKDGGEYTGSAVIRNCEIYNNTDYGIYCFSSYWGKREITIESNYIHDNDNGILQGDIVINNVLENNTKYGFSRSKYVCGNTCTGSQYGMWNNIIKPIIIGNKLIDNEVGINVNSINGIMCGNIIYRGSGTANDYTTAQKTIELMGNSKNNIVTGNQCCGKDITVAGEGNVVSDNIV